MTHTLPLFLAALLSFATLSCKKKKDPPSGKPPIDITGSLYFEETHCADPWHRQVPRAGNDFDGRLKTWLDTTVGTITKYYRHQYPKAIVCESCGCHNGYVIYVWTAQETEKKFMDIGFKKQL